MYLGATGENVEKDLSRTKNGTFRAPPGTSAISQAFSVFECSLKNCTSLEESYLLKIEEEQAMNVKFYEYYNKRV